MDGKVLQLEEACGKFGVYGGFCFLLKKLKIRFGLSRIDTCALLSDWVGLKVM